MTTEELGLLAGHCDHCGEPVDYCRCTSGECPGCEHCVEIQPVEQSQYGLALAWAYRKARELGEIS